MTKRQCYWTPYCFNNAESMVIFTGNTAEASKGVWYCGEHLYNNIYKYASHIEIDDRGWEIINMFKIHEV